MTAVSFADIQPELEARVRRIVWCTVATVDSKDRPRTRILHPIWEGRTAWICTGRHSLKEKHLAHNPWVSLSYWDPQHQQVYADCKAEWVDGLAEKKRLWALFAETPSPYGYDPKLFWPGPESPDFGLLRCDPWRIELMSLGSTGFERTVWHAAGRAA